MAVRRPAPKTPAPAPVAPAPKAAAAAPKVAAPAPAPAKPAAPVKAVEAPVKAAEATVKAAAAGLESNLRAAAAKSIDQGRVAYDRMKSATDEATQTIEASFAATSKGAVELATKAFDAAKANANATFEHLKALAGSRNLSDAVTLHGEFIRKQAEAAVAQAKEFAEIAKKTATETGASLQAQLKNPFNKA